MWRQVIVTHFDQQTPLVDQRCRCAFPSPSRLSPSSAEVLGSWVMKYFLQAVLTLTSNQNTQLRHNLEKWAVHEFQRGVSAFFLCIPTVNIFRRFFPKTCRISLGIEHLKSRFCPLLCMLQTSHVSIQNGNEKV